MKMTDDLMLAQLELLEKHAVGYYTGEVAGEQAKAMDYYMGKPFGTEEIGRSAVVSSDVWDVVEGLTPMVLKPFVSTDEVVRFNPLHAARAVELRDKILQENADVMAGADNKTPTKETTL